MRSQLNTLQQNQETTRSEQQDFQTDVLDLIRGSMEQVRNKNAAMAEMLHGIASNLASDSSTPLPTLNKGKQRPGEEEPDGLGEVLRQMVETDGATTPNTAEAWDTSRRYCVDTCPQSLRMVYDEYYGRGTFELTPVDGGVDALESHFKSKWRKHFSNSQNLHFSRMKTLVKAIHSVAETRQTTTEHMIDIWEPVFQYTNRNSMSKMVQWLKDQGLIRSGKPRGRNAVSP